MAENEEQEQIESSEEAEVQIAEGAIEAPAGKKKLVLLCGALVLALAVGAGGFFFIRAEPEVVAEAPAPTAEELAAKDALRGKVDGIDYAELLGVDLPSDDVGSGGEEAEAGDAPAAPSHMGKIFNLEPFVVNISDGDRDRFLKLKADLELSDEKVNEEMEQRLPQVRDLIISLLGGKSFEDIRTIEGKNFLREEMLLRINALLVSGKARRVFFTEFVVQ